MKIFADAGIPMIFLGYPWTYLLLIPIIGIELAAAGFPPSVSLSSRTWSLVTANLVSTIVGWPLAWALLVGVEMTTTQGGEAYGLNSPLKVILAVTLQAPWLIPYESQLYWMVPAAITFLMFPFFFVSVFIERWAIRLCLPNLPKPERIRAVWRANVASYLVLTAASSAWLVYALVYHPSPH